MKKKFITPKLSIIPMHCETILAASGGANSTEDVAYGGTIGSAGAKEMSSFSLKF